MTTLYRPVVIESAAQADALPSGTVALVREYGEETNATKTVENLWRVVGRWHEYDDEEAVGWTALVPIEAEERKGYVGGKHTKTRLVTPWEDAS